MKVGEVEQVQRKNGAGKVKKLSKQEITIDDERGVCRMVLWEGDEDSIEEGKSYRFEDVGGAEIWRKQVFVLRKNKFEGGAAGNQSQLNLS